MAIPTFNFPPFTQLMPPGTFDGLIAASGINVLWSKGHGCSCVGDTGSSQIIDFNTYSPVKCPVCFGRGFYWDPLTGPWKVLLTLISWLGRNVDMGEHLESDYGLIFQGHPILTISQTFSPILWQQANTFDIYVEADAIERFQATLRVQENEIIPAWHILGSLNIAATGAVVVQDPLTSTPTKNDSYAVSNGTVTLLPNSQYPNGYPKGTSYVVEYYSPPVFVAEEKWGGLSHRRPFGSGGLYPVRFKLALLDLWLRSKIGTSSALGNPPVPISNA